MARRVVVVNGLPASGKSTLAPVLADELGFLAIEKDAIKERFADIAWPRLDARELGAAAMDTMWRLAAVEPDGAVLDGTWFGDRAAGFLAAGLATAGHPRMVEVWCDVPVGTAHDRFRRREPDRHAVHSDAGSGTAFDWEERRPVTDHPIVVDTTVPVDVVALAAEVRARLAG